MNKLTDFYKKKYELKLFYKKYISPKFSYGLFYAYVYDKEVEYFKETFGTYFPYYIKNEDQLKYLNPDNHDFEKKIKEISIRNWNKQIIVPKRKTASSGIYGELFLDFYLRVVSELDPLISYASKRSYSSNNETTGIDNVVFDVQENIEIYLCETKFVNNKTSAKIGLLGDIKGTDTSDSHLSPKYINSYMEFVIFKASESNQLKNETIKKFVDEVNRKLDEGVEFLEVCIQNKVKINVVLFAIFNEKNNKVNSFDTIYKEISEELDIKLRNLGLDSYDYKIVFIPTNNTSMSIKKGINEYYE